MRWVVTVRVVLLSSVGDKYPITTAELLLHTTTSTQGTGEDGDTDGTIRGH